MMSEAMPASDLSALLEASASESRAQRLEALHSLARLPRPIKDARIAAGLLTLDPADAEAALRLELIAHLRDPAARPVVLSWTSAALAARPSAAELHSWRRALIAAAKVIAEAPGPSADAALLSLAALDELGIARAALAALAGRPAFEAPQHVSSLLVLLGVTVDGESQSHVLSLLGRRADNPCGAVVASRILGFTNRFGDNGYLGDVCASSYDGFFTDALPVIATACEQLF